MEKMIPTPPCLAHQMAHKARQLCMISQCKEKQWQEEGRHMFIYHFYDQQQGFKKPHTFMQVQSIIEHIKQQFQSAHDWAAHTGQGIEEDDPDSFHAAVEKRCQYYFDLMYIFSD